MKNRSRLDIIAAILDIAEKRNGALKTEIMYQAFLSFPQVNEYLEILLSRGLLNYSEENRNYSITDLGEEVLKSYREVGMSLMPKSKIHA